MKLTIDQYIHTIFKLRSDVTEDRKRNIEIIHSIMKDRVTFEFPLYHIDSYNINSCIIPLSNCYYHIIDHSMFEYFEWFLYCQEYNQLNLAASIYKSLRRDICISNGNMAKAIKYEESRFTYLTNYDLEKEKLYNRDDFTKKYKIMVIFYFFHEYCHYLIENPMRENNSFDLLDKIVEQALALKRTQRSVFQQIIDWRVLKNYKREYQKNLNFREELMCDFQALLCVLELADEYSVKDIIESVISFLYIHYYIWLAKARDESLSLIIRNSFRFRISILFYIAYLLEDKTFSEMMCELLNSSNKYNDIKNLQCDIIPAQKYFDFHESYVSIMLADYNKDIIFVD